MHIKLTHNLLTHNLLPLIKPITRAISTNTWSKTIKLYWKQKLPLEDTIKSMKEFLKTPTIPRLTQYCSLLHSQHRWLDIYEVYPVISEISKDSTLPLIFDSLYQLENKCDYAAAKSFVDELEQIKLSSYESRCLSVLLGRMERYEDALKYLNTYLNNSDHLVDILAYHEKMNLELICGYSDKSLQSARKLLSIDSTNTSVRLTKAFALINLKKMNEAIIELSILISAITDPRFKSNLYQYRANCRSHEDLNEKILDLEMSCQLYPKGNQQPLLSLLYETAMYDELEAMIKEISKTQPIEKDFNIAAIMGNMYWIAKNDDEKALEWFKYAYEAAPLKYKKHFKMKIEAIKRIMKHH